MKKIFLTLAVASFIWSCKTGPSSSKKDEVDVLIDLVNVKDDKVMVTIATPTFTTETTTFNMPKTVPGTYSEDNYGKFIENVQAFDANGNGLTITKLTENTYKISEATKLSKVTYLVNDSFDTEKGGGFGQSEDVFSPAGTNIKADENFMLNTHGFVGYFEGKESSPYKLTITHPATLQGVSALVDTDDSSEKDVFLSKRYAELVDMPLMYSKPDITTFMVDDMEIIISVYSTNGKYKAADITSYMEETMKAQKRFLGPINSTKKYAILIYLSDQKQNNAQGFGALEHTTSTTVVLSENTALEDLKEYLKDVVSHEFFHIVTPLSVHSNEIHYFDFINPKMSEHLWMYEGVTEYFANLFQVNQGLIDEAEFYERMSQKIQQAKMMNDKMSFTKMSKNVLKAPYKDQYVNVYQKGALIAMCMDIIIRENSNGEKGILNLMQDLSKEYGSKKPFKDEELFAKITSLTYPAVGAFLNKYVAGETPIPYEEFFEKMGVTKTTIEVPGNAFLKDMQVPYISVDPGTREIFFLPSIEPNDFMTNLGIQGDDRLLYVNDIEANLQNIENIIVSSFSWKDGDPVTVKIKRDGKEQELKGTVKLPKENREGYQSTDENKKTVREGWLKG
ncbi:M61 family metallopeptidase [Flavobacterium sp.]|uniref:M61 family metallopeptidase n=1 Tax=Flavobacterium sp. TaxID=239 RepID=UPI004047262D